MQFRLRKTLLCVLALLGQPTFVALAADTLVVEVDAAQTQGAVRDVFGVNRKPGFADKSGSVQFDASTLYSAFGISQVRLHDDDIDHCTIYTAARKMDASGTTQKEVSGCKLQGTTAAPHFIWTPSSTADADLDNPANYDFTLVDEAIRKTVATNAKVYLRLGESYNGPNDTDDPVAWAKVAANIYRHVIGVFKPTAGIAVDPVYVEVHNEPDGGFWRGTTTTFNTLFTETVNRVKSAASAAGHTVKVGGPGFTTNLLTNATRAGNPANGFLTAVNSSGPDFFSAHYYAACSRATLAEAATYLRNVRSLVNSQGGSALPLQITEWNIGLGQSCGNAFYGEQRTRSYDSGVLTLMQDPAQNVEAAHFYAGVPIMALFDLTSVSGKALVNPSSWAFWAHTKLRGATALSAKVCAGSSSCVAGYAAESAPLLALAGQSGSTQTVLVTNDSASTANYTLRLKGLTGSSVRAVVLSPPDGVQQLALAGTPSAPDPSAVQALLGSVSQQAHESLAVSGGQAELSLSLPAYGVQVVEVTQGSTTPVLAAQAISFGTASGLKVGTTGTLSATASSGLAVAFSSLTTSTCTVTGSTVVAVAAGTCTIAANQAGNTSYSPAAQVTQDISISTASFAATPTVSGTNSSLDLSALLTVASSDVGSPGALYVAALLQGSWFAYDGTTWTLWTGGALPAYAQPAALASTANIPILRGMDVSGLVGARVFVGYGKGQTNQASMQDMLNNARYGLLYEVTTGTTPTVPTATAPTGVAVTAVLPQTVGTRSIASSTRLQVNWVAPTAGTVNHYRVDARESIGSSAASTTALSSATGAEIGDLKAGTPYAITVTACDDSACTSGRESALVNATTSEEYWQLQGSGNTFAGLTPIVSDGNARISATRFGNDANGVSAGHIQLYYGPRLSSTAPRPSLSVATSVAAVDASNPASYTSFTSLAGSSGLMTPQSSSTRIKGIATGQGVPLSTNMGGKVRLFFEAEGPDGKTRIYSIDSVDGWVGRDFNTGSTSICATAAAYENGGACAPTLVIGVEGDAENSNAKVSNARQHKLGFPSLSDWRWDGAAGTFLVFTIDKTTGCTTGNANHGYAVWDGTRWSVQYEASGGCPKMFKSAQAALPMHIGGVRYKMYYADTTTADATRPAGTTLPFLGPKVLIYGDGTRTGQADRVDFEDWEAQSSARNVHFLWPNGDLLDASAEGFIDDYHFLTPTGNLAQQVMYMAITDGKEVPMGAAALLLNP